MFVSWEVAMTRFKRATLVKVLGFLSFMLSPNGSVLDDSRETAVADETGCFTDADLLSPPAMAQFKQDGEDSMFFEHAPETAVKVNDSNEQPVFVEEARVKSVKPGPPVAGTEDFLSLTNGFFMRAILVLRNTTNKILTSAVVRFTNRQEGRWFSEASQHSHAAVGSPDGRGHQGCLPDQVQTRYEKRPARGVLDDRGRRLQFAITWL
jgi:hypothetical protein